MNDQYKKLLNETFGDLKNATPKKLRDFLSNISSEAFALRSQLESSNPEEREAAQKQGEALKALLENQINTVSDQLGMTPSEARAFSEAITQYSERAAKPKPESHKYKKLINLVG